MSPVTLPSVLVQLQQHEGSATEIGREVQPLQQHVQCPERRVEQHRTLPRYRPVLKVGCLITEQRNRHRETFSFHPVYWFPVLFPLKQGGVPRRTTSSVYLLGSLSCLRSLGSVFQTHPSHSFVGVTSVTGPWGRTFTTVCSTLVPKGEGSSGVNLDLQSHREFQTLSLLRANKNVSLRFE